MSKHTPYFPDDITKYPPWVARHGLTAPYGECQCGRCHQPAPIAKKTNGKSGWSQGMPKRFVHNHHRVGSDGNHRTYPPLEERFWSKVDQRGPDDCWLWQGNPTPYGYGQISFNGRKVKPSRLAWELHNGPIPPGKSVLHKCAARYPAGDITNRLCVNPAHLYLGDQADNIADTVADERHTHGTEQHNAKLTEDDVREIRRLRAQGMKLEAIAERFGITFSNVGMIARGDTWRHVT